MIYHRIFDVSDSVYISTRYNITIMVGDDGLHFNCVSNIAQIFCYNDILIILMMSTETYVAVAHVYISPKSLDIDGLPLIGKFHIGKSILGLAYK